METSKEQWNENHLNLQAKFFLSTIIKLVDRHLKSNDLVNTERRKNISLISENANLKIEIIKLKDENGRKLHYNQRTTECVGNHLNENVATESLTSKSEKRCSKSYRR